MQAGLEFVVLTVKAQSFLLHQIRKMVSLCVGVVRGVCDESIYNDVFDQTKHCNVNIAPSNGLLLADIHFDDYNRIYAKPKNSDGRLPVVCTGDALKTADAFKRDTIYKLMIEQEQAEKTIWEWLLDLDEHSFAVTKHERADE